MIPAEQSQPHHRNEPRQEITRGTRLSLFHTASCFHNQINPIFSLSSLLLCVLPKCCFFRAFYQSAKAHCRDPFLLVIRSVRVFFFTLKAKTIFKEKKTLAPCKVIGQIAEGARLRAVAHKVTETQLIKVGFI